MKTKYLLLLLLLLVYTSLFSQSNINQPLSINSTGFPPDGSAQLDISAGDKGLLVPRMSTTFRNAIPSPAKGLLVYDTSTRGFWYFDSTAWVNLSLHPILADADNDTRVRVEATPDEDKIRFSTAGNEVMTISADGKVGIGTASPGFNLQVVGDGHFSGPLSAFGAKLENGDFVGSSLNGVINCGGSVNVNANVIGDIATPPITQATGDEDLWIQGDLEVVGNGFKTGGGTWASISDARLKKDIEPFTDGLEQLIQIDPVRFRYNERAGLPDGGKQYVGVIAQDVLPVAPYMISEIPLGQVVREDDNGNEIVVEKGEMFYTYDGTALTYILVNAVKEQQAMIDKLAEKSNRLDEENVRLQLQLTRIQAALAQAGIAVEN